MEEQHEEQRDAAPSLTRAHVLTSPNWTTQRGRTVTLVTQLSLDRLDRLLAQCASWRGLVCAAVYCPLPPPSLLAHQTLRRCFAEVKECMAAAERNGAAMKVTLMTEKVESLHDAGVRYPVNALRNAALSMAETDLVLLLDVDFLVSHGAAARWASEDAAGALWQSCCARCELFVLPAFQVSKLEEAHAAVACDKSALVGGWRDGWLSQFAAAEFPQGHRATQYGRWLRERSQYLVAYEEGFEPFVLAPRRLIPWQRWMESASLHALAASSAVALDSEGVIGVLS